MIIDFHAHPDFKNQNEKYTSEEFIEAMNQGGIDISCVYGCDQADAGSCPPWRDKRLISIATNVDDEELASFCKKYPDRLFGISSINADRYQPELKVKRAITEFGMKAVKIYPHSGFYPNDANLIRTYELCSNLGIPVIIHSGIKANRWQWMKFNQPIYVDDIATNFPDLKIVLCHGGYPWIEEFIAVVYSNPNIWVDLTFMEVIEEVYLIPGLVENTVKRLFHLIGAKRLIWGSEGPYMYLPLFGNHGPSNYQVSQYKLVKRFDFLSEDDKKDILGINAGRLLGIIKEL